MQVWQEQLQGKLDQVAEYASDWDACLDMVSRQPETTELNEFLDYLVPRLKRMQRQFNQVEYDAKLRAWSIYNYDYKMFQYCRRKYPGAVITPQRIVLADEELDLTDRDKLQQQL